MESYAVVREAEGRYRLTREEPVGAGRKGYFVAEVTDRRNGVHNTFGIWRVTASVDGDPLLRIPHGRLHPRPVALLRRRELLPACSPHRATR